MTPISLGSTAPGSRANTEASAVDEALSFSSGTESKGDKGEGEAEGEEDGDGATVVAETVDAENEEEKEEEEDAVAGTPALRREAPAKGLLFVTRCLTQSTTTHASISVKKLLDSGS